MIKVFFPRGGGGSWLRNLIWHLEKKWTIINECEDLWAPLENRLRNSKQA